MSLSCWRTSRFAIDLSRPQVMGIVNATPDSFSDGGLAASADAAIAHSKRLLAEGADILDIGGESSRPGAAPLDLATELSRVLPVIAAAVDMGCPVSIDTTKAEVMRAALGLGADIVNDIRALRSPGALDAVAAHPNCGVCLMHMRGTPRSMQSDTTYGDIVSDVAVFLDKRIAVAHAAGIALERIVVDPGIGFAKTQAQNFELLARQTELLDRLKLPGPNGRDVPLLVGWSRKSSLARLVGLPSRPPHLGGDPPMAPAAPAAPTGTSAASATIDIASAAAAVIAVQRGARIVRVHDVATTVVALRVWQAVRDADR